MFWNHPNIQKYIDAISHPSNPEQFFTTRSAWWRDAAGKKSWHIGQWVTLKNGEASSRCI